MNWLLEQIFESPLGVLMPDASVVNWLLEQIFESVYIATTLLCRVVNWLLEQIFESPPTPAPPTPVL